MGNPPINTKSKIITNLQNFRHSEPTRKTKNIRNLKK